MNANNLVLRDRVQPRWIGTSGRFWYRVMTPSGVEFTYVDPAKRVRRPAFDSRRLATALGSAADTMLVADSLPFQTIDWREEGKTTSIVVSLRGKSWQCDLAHVSLRDDCGPDVGAGRAALARQALGALNRQPQSLGPQHRHRRSARAHDRRDHAIRLRSERRVEHELGHGPANGHAQHSDRHSVGRLERILTHKLDQRHVPELHSLQSVRADSVRPKLWSFSFPLPGDSLAQATWWVFDVESGKTLGVGGHRSASPTRHRSSSEKRGGRLGGDASLLSGA